MSELGMHYPSHNIALKPAEEGISPDELFSLPSEPRRVANNHFPHWAAPEQDSEG
jgi:hypothetical protein